VPLVSAYRYDGPEVNTSLAHSEAKILQDKIHDKAYADEEVIRILTTRSKAQLLATFNSYNDQFSHPINKVNKNYPLISVIVPFSLNHERCCAFELNYLNDEFCKAAITLNDNKKNFYNWFMYSLTLSLLNTCHVQFHGIQLSNYIFFSK
jgi:hypothetical protein